jgi:hypothetical protein
MDVSRESEGGESLTSRDYRLTCGLRAKLVCASNVTGVGQIGEQLVGQYPTTKPTVLGLDTAVEGEP